MRFFIVGLCIAMAMTGCKTGLDNKEEWQPNEALPQLKAKWEKEYAAWKKLNIQDYQFVYSILDIGVNQKITVKNGIHESAIDIYFDELGDPFFKTIDEIFESIYEDFLIEENHEYSPDQTSIHFSVGYDPEYHYPVEYTRIDKYNVMMDGSGFSLLISEFTPL